MSGFKEVNLGTLTQIKTGRLDANESSVNGKYPFFTCSKKPLKIDQYSFDGDYILVAGNGDLNVKHYSGRFDAYQRTYVIKCDNKKLKSRYMFYFMSKYVDILRNQSIGGVIKYIKIGNITDAKIPLPPLKEQKKIAAILDAADSLRQKDQQLIEHYTRLGQSLFLEMFGDPVVNPMGWMASKLDDVAEIVSGVTKGRKLKSKEVFDAPYMRVANVQAGYLNLNEVKTIPATKDDLRKFILKKGDVLLTEGGDPDKLGRGTVWNEEIENCIHQNHIFRVRLTCNESTPLYLSRLCGSEYGKRYFLKSGKQTTGIASINKAQLKKFPVLRPPFDLQNKFAKHIEKIEQQKQQAQASLVKSEALFNSLLQRAFKGELST